MKTTIGTIIALLTKMTLSLINIFGVLAFVAFFYGLGLFLLNTDNKTMKERGKNIMVWGTIALFVLVSIWGIIGFLQKSFIGGNMKPLKPAIIVPIV